MPTNNTGETAQVVDVFATVEARDETRPPKLIFAFPGLDDPLPLWTELEALGWFIPDRVEPDLEIDWDAPDGAGYRVVPYIVEGFEVVAEGWPASKVAERSLDTINVLRRYGVELDIPIAYLAFLRRAQVAILDDPERRALQIAKPTSVPETILLSRQPWAVLVDEPTVDVYETATAPGQPTWYWAESSRQMYDIGKSAATRDAIVNTVDMGWELHERVELPEAVDGQDRVLRFLVQDVVDGSDMLVRLRRLAGHESVSMLMSPVRNTSAATNCIVIVCIVPSERFAAIGAQIIAEFPDTIARGRRYTSAQQSAA